MRTTEAKLAAAGVMSGASARAVLRWLLLTVLATVVLWLLRRTLDKAHMALAYLVIVLAASARHGRRLGRALAVLCFLCFNFFLLPPYYTFHLANPLDWVVLATFLVTAAVAAHLLDRAQQEAAAANQRAEEIDVVSTLGAETLNAARAEDAAQAIARVLRSALNVSLCDIHLWNRGAATGRRIAAAETTTTPLLAATDELFRYVVEQGVVAIGRTDGTTHLSHDSEIPIDRVLAAQTDARMILLPLKVRGRAVGVLRIAHDTAITLDHAQARFAAMLSNYAALGVERVRLVAEEEHAERLRQANAVKDALLASVSHDLRTPLTTIKALAHELGLNGDERVHAIEDEADRLNRLVADLLDLSSLNAGALPINLEIVAAEDLVGAALQRAGGMLRDRRIDVSLPPGAALPIGRFDFTQSLRILVNLLENAVKYGPPDKPIELRVREDHNWLVFEVLDRGPGVPPQAVEQIFQPFYRAAGPVPDASGTGLGLAIARGLAQAQGGSIEYEPRAGGGSLFRVRLPAVAASELSDMSS